MCHGHMYITMYIWYGMVPTVFEVNTMETRKGLDWKPTHPLWIEKRPKVNEWLQYQLSSIESDSLGIVGSSCMECSRDTLALVTNLPLSFR